MAYDYQPFTYVPPPGLTKDEPTHPVIIVGAGPIGLAMALELANFGVASVVLDDNNVVSVGSRAICWSKRSLEIFDRLGIADRAVEKGVTWQVGRTFYRDAEVFNFDLLPEDGHKMPAFINLQQYYVEQYLAEAALANPLIDVRFKNKVTDFSQDDVTTVTVETPDGTYELAAEYLIACDGANSTIRDRMGLEFDGELFEERFLIADVEMEADFPSERWFWFEPTFHTGQSALLHKQPDNIYRIDLQLGWDVDPVVEREPENVIPRISAVVGHQDFRLDWVSVYTFQCRRLARFVHGRVIFAGDSAHVVSPFGARGGNGGLQDVDNLGWKLAAVLEGSAPIALLESYNRERIFGAEENIRNSARATKFMTPADGVERLFRDQVLRLATKAPFARGWVNSGRLSRPCVYPAANGQDRLPLVSCAGSVAPDAPLGNGWLLPELAGHLTLLSFGCEPPDLPEIRTICPEMNEHLRLRYLGESISATYLVRPDQVVASRWEGVAGKTEIRNAVAAIWEGAK